MVSVLDPDVDLVRRITSAWARDAVVFVETLTGIDPSWGSETFELADGAAVLCGPGLYVNRAIAAGRDRPLSDDEWELLEARSAAVGVPATIEITEVSHPAVRAAAQGRGYEIDHEESALARPTDLSDVPPPDPGFEIVPANRGLLPLWQETTACGWGHEGEGARRASDAFARVAAVVDGERFTLVRHAGSGRPLGCASMSIRDGVATLGGMSTLPEARGQGVQTALIRHRLRVAAASGCDLATSVAAPGGISERNLLRHGFERVFTIEHWVRRSNPRSNPASEEEP
jgi:GNAT superfamily N-acetyltransferase